jgi:NosR/NirI family nitrous oxide reductase transcriptional regulator
MARLNNTTPEQQTSLAPQRGEGLRVRGGQSHSALREESSEHPTKPFTIAGKTTPHPQPFSPLGGGRSRRSASSVPRFNARITFRTSLAPQRGEGLRVRGGQSHGALREESSEHPTKPFTITGRTTPHPQPFSPLRGEGRSRRSAFPVQGFVHVRALLFLLVLGVLVSIAQAGPDQDMRFPAPEFRSGYTFPETTVPPATSETRQWIDVAVLAAALSLAAWLAVKRHSRRGIFWLMIFSLLYFGFYKQGCICPIGSIQNVALSLFNTNYALPVTVLIFFGLPLIFALFFGRVFCSSICALGAIQDLVAIKPIQLSRKVTVGLSVIPYAYLGLAVLLAATNTGFLICRYDPFIGFFRLTGNAPYLYLGAAFLIVGVFIARPYCRFFCPYGVLLGWMSRLSRWHLTITPTSCVNCRLCETSCPFDYIHKPNLGLAREARQTGVRRLAFLFLMLPVLIALGGWVGHRLSVPLSRYHSTVAVAEQILAETQNPALKLTLETKTFRSKGMTENELIKDAMTIRSQMNFGGWLVGGFIGLVFGLKLIGFSTVRTQKDYEVDRTHCFSCARCCTYCPNDPGYRSNFIPTPVAANVQPQKPVPEMAGQT